MALPPLELFSLKKRSPCCRAASSSFQATGRGVARRPPEAYPAALSWLASLVDQEGGEPVLRDPAQAARMREKADVAQLVEQLIRNQ
jgi:hypothetical protein